MYPPDEPNMWTRASQSVVGHRADAGGTVRRAALASLCMFGVPFSPKLGFGFEIPVSFPRTGDTAPLKRAGRWVAF